MKRYTIFSLLLLLQLNISQASCESFFERIKSLFFEPTYEIVISNELRSDLKEFARGENPTTKNVSFRSFHSMNYAFLLSKLPPSFIQLISNTPKNKRYIAELKNKIFYVDAKLKGTFLDIIFEGLHFESRGANPTEKFDLMIQKKLSEYRELDQHKKVEIREAYEKTILISKAFRNWETNYKKSIEVISREGNKITFKVGETILKGEIVHKRGGQMVIFKAPKEMFAHPAWNPLDHKYIQDLVSSPNYRKKEIYPVTIGQNGKLYLMDGNHRSTLDTREMLPAEVFFPLETANIRIHLDLIGRAQPTTLEKIKILRGELDPWTFVQ